MPWWPLHAPPARTLASTPGVPWAVGTMVWTLFDYYGEPPVGGPEVSSTYGQYDLCGFPKAAAFWSVDTTCWCPLPYIVWYHR